MIRKLIHYCWFGNGPKNETIRRCLHSWKQNLSGYEFRPCLDTFSYNQFSSQRHSGLLFLSACNTSSTLHHTDFCMSTLYGKTRI